MALLEFLFLAAEIYRQAGRVGVGYSDHYEEEASSASGAVKTRGLGRELPAEWFVQNSRK